MTVWMSRPRGNLGAGFSMNCPEYIDQLVCLCYTSKIDYMVYYRV